MTSFLEAFLPSFRRNLRYAKFFQCLPFEWSEKQEKFIIKETMLKRVAIRTWIILGGLYIAFQIAYLAFGRHALANKLVGCLILTVYCCCFGARAEFGSDSTLIGNINRLLSGHGICNCQRMLFANILKT